MSFTTQFTYNSQTNAIQTPPQFNIIESFAGHTMARGIDAGKIKNPSWKMKHNETGEEFMLMFCEKNTFVKLCEESHQILLNFNRENECVITWYAMTNGYIGGKVIGGPQKKRQFFIHQIIMNCYGQGRGTKVISVDHIDRDPLNNAKNNLRLATREEQEQNTKGIMAGTKRARKESARPLPEGITQEMLLKYVVYYDDVYNKELDKHRYYFSVERHPKLAKFWTTTKSGKVSIEEKLRTANQVVTDLEKDVYPVNFT